MKVFISQPMKGKTDEEIREARAIAEEYLRIKYGEDVEILNSFFQGKPVTVNPLKYLAESIRILADADAAFFCRGWTTARGCLIEHQCAESYGIRVIEQIV